MPTCKVQGCNVGSGHYKGPHYTLFGFPKSEPLLTDWKSRLGLPNLEVKERTKICAKHFEEDAFIRDEDNVDSRGRKRTTRILKPLAYPTLFLEQKPVRIFVVPENNVTLDLNEYG